MSTLTLRLDRGTRRASFLLHWRDPARVGHAGGLYQVGTDPLTYATDLLTVAVFGRGVFDELFSLSPRRNAEGQVLASREFAAHVIDRLLTSEPLQAAGAAVLRLAWRHRETLLS